MIEASLILCAAIPAYAATIDTAFIEGPWPKQRVRSFEVGRYEVSWRESAGKSTGIFAGVNFSAPLDRQKVWDLSNDYTDIGKITPGVTSVKFTERTPNRQVIQVDIKVLWKTLQLVFEVEQEPPRVIRFRLVNEALGEYRGVCVFNEAHPPKNRIANSATDVELSTWLKPSRPVPIGLLLLIERMTLLQGVKHFLESCDKR